METIYWTCGGVANMINILSVKLNSFFLGSHNSQEVTLPGKSHFLGSRIFGKVLSPILTNPCHPCFSAAPVKVKFAGKSYFKRNSHFLGSLTSQEVTFSLKKHFPGSQISRKSHIPEIHILPRN